MGRNCERSPRRQSIDQFLLYPLNIEFNTPLRVDQLPMIETPSRVEALVHTLGPAPEAENLRGMGLL